MGRIVLAAALAILGGAEAAANPDVWVKVLATYRFEERAVTAITYEWQFDEYFSARTVRAFDANANGAFEPDEIERLRLEVFEPLAKFQFHVHVWVGDDKRKPVNPTHFEARVQDKRLVYRFTVPVDPPADPRARSIVASLHDKDTVIDFEFVKKDFLLVEGTIDPDCKFRLARGKGAQAGHAQSVTLKCGGTT